MGEITLTHTGSAWKVQNFIFYHFWQLKNSSHTQTFKYNVYFIVNRFFLNARKNVLLSESITIEITKNL